MEWLRSETVLRNWLLGVASLRALSVGLGYLSPLTLQARLFNRAGKQFTGLVGRTFAVWTAVTCLVTTMAALNLRNPAMLWTCCATFVAANCFFLLELLVYRTVSLGTIALPFFLASESQPERPRRFAGQPACGAWRRHAQFSALPFTAACQCLVLALPTAASSSLWLALVQLPKLAAMS